MKLELYTPRLETALKAILAKATRSELEDLAEELNYADPWGAANKAVLIDWIVGQLLPEDEEVEVAS